MPQCCRLSQALCHAHAHVCCQRPQHSNHDAATSARTAVVPASGQCGQCPSCNYEARLPWVCSFQINTGAPLRVIPTVREILREGGVLQFYRGGMPEILGGWIGHCPGGFRAGQRMLILMRALQLHGSPTSATRAAMHPHERGSPCQQWHSAAPLGQPYAALRRG